MFLHHSFLLILDLLLYLIIFLPLAGRAAADERTEQAIARATRSDALAGLVGNGEQLRGAWADLLLTRQAAIVQAVLEHAVIGPGTRGIRAFDPDRVTPLWRL